MNKKIVSLFLLLILAFASGSFILLNNRLNSTDEGPITHPKGTKTTVFETTTSSLIKSQLKKQDSYTLRALPETNVPTNISNITNSFNPLFFSLPKTDSPFYKQTTPISLTESSSELNTLEDLFAQEVEPKNIFNSPLGGRILLDEDDEISGLEINFTLKKNL